jgi:hypothetical protein
MELNFFYRWSKSNSWSEILGAIYWTVARPFHAVFTIKDGFPLEP